MFQTAKVTFKIIQGHWQWCYSIGHTRFPIRTHHFRGNLSSMH